MGNNLIHSPSDVIPPVHETSMPFLAGAGYVLAVMNTLLVVQTFTPSYLLHHVRDRNLADRGSRAQFEAYGGGRNMGQSQDT